MPETWVVLLEAADSGGSGGIDRDAVARLLGALDRGRHAAALHSADRYALQLTARGTGPAEALHVALSRWTHLVGELGLPSWQLVRTEVLTPDELDRDLQGHDPDDMPIAGPGPSRAHDDDQVADELLRRAFTDSLTGLLSLEAFEHRLEDVLLRTGGQRTAIVCLGLASMDARVAGVGADEVMRVVAGRLGGVLRAGDAVARFGVDACAILLEDTTEEVAVAVADRVLGALRCSATVQGNELDLSARAGVALSEPGDDAPALMGKAGAALTCALRGNGDGPRVLFRTGMSDPAARPALGRDEVLHDPLVRLLLLQAAMVAANEADTLERAAELVHQICCHTSFAIGHLWAPPADASSGLASSVWHTANGIDCREFQEASDQILLAPGVDLTGRAWAAGAPVWSADLSAEWVSRRRGQGVRAGLQSGFAVPVLVGREVVAVVECFSRTPLQLSRSFVDALASIGTELGRVVERQRAAAAAGRSQEQLRMSEAQLREGQAMARLGTWHFDLRTGKRRWSDEMYGLYGLEPGSHDIDPETLLATVHPADRARAQAALARLVHSGERAGDEIRIVRPDGKVRWHRAEGVAITDDDGLVVAIRGRSQDITERKLVEEALRERAEQLSQAQRLAQDVEEKLAEEDLHAAKELCQRILETARDGILTLDAQDNTIFANARLAQILGYSVEELVGMPASALMDEETRAALFGCDQRRGTGISEQYEARLRAKDGTRVEVLVCASPLVDKNGQFGGALAMVTDVSALRQAESVLRMQRRHLQADVDPATDGPIAP